MFNFGNRKVHVVEVVEIGPKEAKTDDGDLSGFVAFCSVKEFPTNSLTKDLAIMLKSKGLLNLYDLQGACRIEPEVYKEFKCALEQWQVDRQDKDSVQI